MIIIAMKSAYSATEARKKLFELINHASKPGLFVTITRDGEPKVVMMSVEEFDGWQETLEILSDPDLVKDIKKGLSDIKLGKVYTDAEVRKKLKIR